MFVNGRRVDEKGDFVSFDTRRASMFILLCNAVQGRRGSDRSPSFLPFPAVGERAIASGQGTRLRRQEGVRKCRISPQDSWHAAEYVGIASHGLRPFPIRATLFVVAEKLPVHLTSSCSFAVARGAWIKTPLCPDDFLLPILNRRVATKQVVLIPGSLRDMRFSLGAVRHNV